MNINIDNRTTKILRTLLKRKIRELDKQFEKSGRECNTDDSKILLGKHALAEELIHEIQGEPA